MKKLILAATVILCVSGCSKPDYTIYTKTTIKGSDKAAEFIIECARAANPLSDEEGEDLVEECKYTAKEIYGKTEFFGYVAKHATGCYSHSKIETRLCIALNHNNKD